VAEDGLALETALDAAGIGALVDVVAMAVGGDAPTSWGA